VTITQQATTNTKRQQDLPSQENRQHKIGPNNKKRKDKGHEPVRLKNFTVLTKSLNKH
jgi:hypothetical protein